MDLGESWDLGGLLRPFSPYISPPPPASPTAAHRTKSLQMYSTSADSPMEWRSYNCTAMAEAKHQVSSGYNSTPAGMAGEAKKPERGGGGRSGGGGGGRVRQIFFPISLWKTLGKEAWGEVDVTEGKEAHVRLLAWLTEREAIDQRRLSRLKRGVQRLRGEMYGALQMYTLVLGVIYLSVVNTTVLSCEDAWGPALLALLAAGGGGGGVAFRFLEYSRDQYRYSTLQSRARKLEEIITNLRHYVLLPGTASFADIDSIVRSLPPSLYEAEAKASTPEYSFLDSILSQTKTTLLPLAFALSIFVPIFIAASCKRILCGSS